MTSSPTPRAPEIDPKHPSGFSRDEFRSALGTFATGVTIVTACDAEGKRVGLTANSFNSVSLAPPLVLWSLAQRASTMAAFAAVSHYAIHVLASDQRALAERFSSRVLDRFSGLPTRTGAGGAPILEGVAAVFECANRSRYVEGDHIIFVGQVEHCEHRPGAQPLIFHGGRFFTELPL